MKRLLSLVALLVVLVSTAKADEGMWLLPLLKQLNEADMQQKGLQLSAEDIYSVNNSSLKDAILVFGRGCTGEFISPDGLLLTNHHCGYSEIQKHSTVEHDYLKEGFWAEDRGAEIVSPGLSVKLLDNIVDVTAEVLLNVVDSMSHKVRRDSISASIFRLKADTDSTLTISVKSFFSGNAYYRFAYREYKDVRFVGAPPSSIGKFGADTDNWMWPRHTADFSLFRVYSAPDGSPAEYAEENVPYIPKQHLKISLKGVQNNDFAMIMGFPGSTSRYMSSWGVEQRMNIYNQSLIDIRAVKQNIWLQDMQSDPAVRIQYASKYARSSNYYKNSIGMNKQLKSLDVLDRKRQLEHDFNEWVNADETRVDEYGDVLSALEKAYLDREEAYREFIILRESLYSSIEIYKIALQANSLSAALVNGNKEEIAEAVESLKESASVFYKDYNAGTDKKVTAAMLTLYKNKVGVDVLSDFYRGVDKKFDNYEGYADRLFSKSIFASEASLIAFLEKPKVSKLQKDLAFVGGNSIRDAYYEASRKYSKQRNLIAYGDRKFEKGLHLMKSDKNFYPDANFTMRLTYGTVGDYKPADGVHYSYYTTLAGVMEKEDPDNWEFIVPKKLKELYEKQDYGPYADVDSTLHVCFITNNDITGGNSGSPVLNANGELFGLAFDSNWEGMSGDIAFESYLQRVVNVDIRYVLFIIDKFAGAKYLIDEMELVP